MGEIRKWVLSTIEKLTNSDADALTTFIMSMLEKEENTRDSGAIKRALTEELKLFLEDETESFTNQLINRVYGKEVEKNDNKSEQSSSRSESSRRRRKRSRRRRDRYSSESSSSVSSSSSYDRRKRYSKKSYQTPNNNNNNNQSKNENHRNNQAKMNFPPVSNLDKCLKLIKIPHEYQQKGKIAEYFARFGGVTSVEHPFNNDLMVALIRFAAHESAMKAFNSPEAIFGNRFVRLHWYRDLKSLNANQNVEKSEPSQETAMSNVNNTNMESSGTPTQIVMVEKPKPLTVSQSRYVAPEIAAKQEEKKNEMRQRLLEKQKAEQRIIEAYTKQQQIIVNELKSSDLTAAERQQLVDALKMVVEKKDSLMYKNKMLKPVGGASQKRKTVGKTKLDNRTTRIALKFNGGSGETSNEECERIIETYKKFGKIISSTIIKEQHIVLHYVNYDMAFKAVNFGNFHPEHISSVEFYEQEKEKLADVPEEEGENEQLNSLMDQESMIALLKQDDMKQHKS